MSIDKHNLYKLYYELLPKFTELAQEANSRGVYFDLLITPDGDINFSSKERFTEKGKEYIRSHSIKQGTDYVQESSKTYFVE